MNERIYISGGHWQSQTWMSHRRTTPTVLLYILPVHHSIVLFAISTTTRRCVCDGQSNQSGLSGGQTKDSHRGSNWLQISSPFAQLIPIQFTTASQYSVLPVPVRGSNAFDSSSSFFIVGGSADLSWLPIKTRALRLTQIAIDGACLSRKTPNLPVKYPPRLLELHRTAGMS